jgi:hypothetical protein
VQRAALRMAVEVVAASIAAVSSTSRQVTTTAIRSVPVVREAQVTTAPDRQVARPASPATTVRYQRMAVPGVFPGIRVAVVPVVRAAQLISNTPVDQVDPLTRTPEAGEAQPGREAQETVAMVIAVTVLRPVVVVVAASARVQPLETAQMVPHQVAVAAVPTMRRQRVTEHTVRSRFRIRAAHRPTTELLP